jgi:hypothetical protein
VPVVEVVEALPVAAGAKLHTTLTIKVVPGGTAPVTTFFTVRVGAVCAPLSVLPIRGTPVGEDHGRQAGPSLAAGSTLAPLAPFLLPRCDQNTETSSSRILQ